MTSLFANQPEERAAALEQRINDLIYGKGAGLFNQSLPAAERAVLKALKYHTSSSNPITIRALRERTELTEREVKDAIRELRLSFQLPIGASRSGSAGGYFFAITPEDVALFVASTLRQVRAELELVKAVGGTRAVAEMLGQLTLESSAEVQS